MMIRWLRFLAVSLVIHGILIAIYRAEFPRVAAPKAQPVKIKIVEIPRTPPAAPAPTRPTTGVRVSRPAKASTVPASRPAQGASAPAPRAATYADLFPSAAEGLASADRAESARAAASTSFDPEGDAYPRDAQMRSLARLDQFAASLGGRISVPDGLKKLAPTGYAYARLTRAGGGWKVTNASGDPYYRALLFDVLASQPPAGYLFHLLDDTDYPTVRIFFSLVPAYAGDETAKPLVARTASNKVFLDYSHVVIDEKWQMAMGWNNPAGVGVVGANVIGIGSYLWGKATETDGSDDLDVKRLRLSPAFSRPIGR